MRNILHCQSVEEAVVWANLDLPERESPIAWSPDKYLCCHCWSDLAKVDDLCLTCSEVLKNIDREANHNAGILIHSQDAGELSSLTWEGPIVSSISQNELLLLTHASNASKLVISLHDSRWSCAVIFPSRGDMIFADALAMSRYYASQIISSYPDYSVKIFFNHSHMRTLDLGNMLSIDLLSQLSNVALMFKESFPGDKISALNYIFTKDRINQKYELNRFYSMCNQDQKLLLSQIEMTELDPSRAKMLINMVRYV